MIDVVQFIQKSIIRDASPILTPILTSILNEIIKEMAAYHNWRCLRRTHTVPLETDNEFYTLSGENQDLEKIREMWYGDDEDPLDEYDEAEFRRTVLNNVIGDTPLCFVPLGRQNDYSWDVRIYPCSATSFDTLSYSYQKMIKPPDIALFSNIMVFVNGTLWKFYTNEKEYVRAHDYKEAYHLSREMMRINDKSTVHPRSKVTSSTERLRFLEGRIRLRGLRRK